MATRGRPAKSPPAQQQQQQQQSVATIATAQQSKAPATTSSTAPTSSAPSWAQKFAKSAQPNSNAVPAATPAAASTPKPAAAPNNNTQQQQSNSATASTPQPQSQSPSSKQRTSSTAGRERNNKQANATSPAASKSTPAASNESQPTPSSPAQDTSSPDARLSKAAPGSTVVLFTSVGERLTGKLFVYDSSTKSLGLEVQSSSNYYTILNATHITLESITAPDSKFQYPTAPTPTQIEQREKRAVAERHAQARRIGKNVSPDAQRLFDALSKTVPCEWQEQDIIVMSSVRIAPPYTNVAAVTGGKAPPAQLERVRKMLMGERQRLHLT